MKKIYLIVSLMLLSAVGQAQLQNLDFEIWDDPVDANIFSNRPTGWMWYVNNILTDGTNFMHPPDTNAQNNDYAFKLSVWYNHTKDAAIQGAPIDYRPARLKGYYKYTDNVITGAEGTIADTAMVSVYLTTIQPWPMVIDTIAVGKVNLTYSEEYALFEVDIIYLSEVMPQAVTVYLDPSLVARYEDRYYSSLGEPIVSFFTVDNLSLEGEVVVGVDASLNSDGISIYPNPAQDVLQISMNEKQPIAIYTSTGTLVENVVSNPLQTLDVSHYPAGVYFIKSNAKVLRFIKK